MDNNEILLGKVGEWIFYKYFFDKTNNCFIEEKYHYEYLDTGTILDASNIVTAQHVYGAFVEYMNTDGITNLLKYVDNFELPQTVGNQISEQCFFEKLDEIDKVLRNRLERIDSTYIFRNHQGNIIGVLSKTKYFWVYMDSYKKSKGFISKNEAFVYIIESLCSRYKLSNSTPTVNDGQSKPQNKAPEKKSKKIVNFFKKRKSPLFVADAQAQTAFKNTK